MSMHPYVPRKGPIHTVIYWSEKSLMDAVVAYVCWSFATNWCNIIQSVEARTVSLKHQKIRPSKLMYKIFCRCLLVHVLRQQHPICLVDSGSDCPLKGSVLQASLKMFSGSPTKRLIRKGQRSNVLGPPNSTVSFEISQTVVYLLETETPTTHGATGDLMNRSPMLQWTVL